MSSAGQRVQPAPPLSPPGWAGVGTCTLGLAEPVAPRRFDFHVLMLTTAGHGTVEVDFAEQACRPGTLLWIRPGQAVRLGEGGPGEGGPGGGGPGGGGLDASFVTFEPKMTDGGDHPAGRIRWQLAGEDEDAVISEFTQLAVDGDRHSPGPLAADLLHHQLTVLLLRIALLTEAETGGPAGSEGRTYARFHRRLENGHSYSRRVEDYAEKLGCSVRTLTRASLAVAGRTAKQVVDDRVALEARRLLACTPMSVAEVGRHLGFPEPTNFGRFFHREVGVSPGQFRAEATLDGRTQIPGQRRPAD